MIKKTNSFILCFLILIILQGCQDVKKGFSGKQINQGEEFLIKKKNPLEIPPNFEELPKPGDDLSIKNTEKSNEILFENEFNKILESQDNQIIEDNKNKKSNSTLEEELLEKIK